MAMNLHNQLTYLTVSHPINNAPLEAQLDEQQEE